MKFIAVLSLSFMMTNAFAEDLSKAFNKLEDKDCTRLLSIIRKKTRVKAGLTEKIEKVELGQSKDSKFALLYLKLNNDQICSEQPSRSQMGSITVKYICRDKSGKVALEKLVEAGHSDCTGDAPKFQ